MFGFETKREFNEKINEEFIKNGLYAIPVGSKNAKFINYDINASPAFHILECRITNGRENATFVILLNGKDDISKCQIIDKFNKSIKSLDISSSLICNNFDFYTDTFTKTENNAYYLIDISKKETTIESNNDDSNYLDEKSFLEAFNDCLKEVGFAAWEKHGKIVKINPLIGDFHCFELFVHDEYFNNLVTFKLPIYMDETENPEALLNRFNKAIEMFKLKFKKLKYYYTYNIYEDVELAFEGKTFLLEDLYKRNSDHIIYTNLGTKFIESKEDEKMKDMELENQLKDAIKDESIENTIPAKTGFAITVKDIINSVLGVSNICGSIFGIKKFKKSESKSSKALWIGFVILNIFGAFKSIFSLVDSLMLPEVEDDIDED
nr:MAG TPA: hypothetical protein [Caudoviricetes sp.]